MSNEPRRTKPSITDIRTNNVGETEAVLEVLTKVGEMDDADIEKQFNMMPHQIGAFKDALRRSNF